MLQKRMIPLIWEETGQLRENLACQRHLTNFHQLQDEYAPTEHNASYLTAIHAKVTTTLQRMEASSIYTRDYATLP